MRVAPEVLDREPSYQRGQGRQGRDRATDFVKQQANLEESHPHAAERFRHGQPEKVGVPQPTPHVSVEEITLCFYRLQTFGGDFGLEDLSYAEAEAWLARLLAEREDAGRIGRD